MQRSIITALGFAAGAAVAETVHGVVVFTRHGDRTTKHYGAQALTRLGASQNFEVGSGYRARYLDADSDHQILGISQDEYVSSQIYASAPNQGILSNTATAFLQGLYPPLEDIEQGLSIEALNNGSDSSAPLEGYQYVLLQGQDTDSPDTIWIKGDDGCPAYTESAGTFEDSEVFAQRVEDTRDFYSQFYEYLDDVYDLVPANMTYENAYTIFDLINVARIHNESSNALEVSDEDMFQLRTLADSQEFGGNYNASQPIRSIGARTLSGGVFAQLNQTVSTQGRLKFSLLSGSYDTFLAFFGSMGLTSISDDFYGLPEYASTMAFELFSDDTEQFPEDTADLRVRWLFRNGTAGELTAFPLFGRDDETMSWAEFESEMADRAITDVGTWCDTCSSTEDFCAAYESDNEDGSEAEAESSSSGSDGLSNAAAGGIGAGVTLAVVGIIGALAFALTRKRRATAPTPAHTEAGVVNQKGSESGSMDAASR